MRYFFTTLLLLMFLSGSAQSVNAPLNEDYYHWIDRYEIRQGTLNKYFHTSWKPYMRSDIVSFIQEVRVNQTLSSVDQFNMSYLLNDSWEWADSTDNASRKPFLKHFYRVQSDLYHVNQPDFDLHVNPVLYLGGGVESASDVNTFINTRGVEIRGMVDQKLGFYSFIGENQVIFPQYVRQKIADELVVPHEGFWKNFKENGVDFFTARGYLSFQATDHINLQFGHDRFKVGNGYRSMILSDFAPAYLFLKMNTKVWKINYTNLFTELTADVRGNANGLTGTGSYPSKYMAMHHLSVNIGDKLNVGLFESVIFGADTVNGDNFDLQYLNPIIFYRAIEQQNGSPDNVLLGMDFKWLVAKRLSVYGQLVLDEFLFDNIKEGEGWWGNKYGVQIGGEYIDALGINNLDLQLEANIARPYIYSHGTAFGSYSQYRQPLAHPRGANFTELVAIARYQPHRRVNLQAKLIYSNYGADTTGVNWGGNILLNNSTREMNFNNEIGQGVSTDLIFGNFTVSYHWKHNFFIDISHTYRKTESEVADLSNSTNYTSAAIRWNIPQRLNEF
ncbi:MAG: hypothetical protein R3345_13190 [Fulvivirga sp.]|nr:hypothetical protein [Fulvivirga sp.]